MFKPLIFMLGLAAGCGAVHAQALSREAWYAVPDARGVQLINVECGEGFFDPPEIVVKGNRPVELLLRTSEDALEFVTDLTPGLGKAVGRQKTSHRFTPGANGHFAMGCRKQGGNPGNDKKRGVLTVVPDNGESG